MERKKRKRKMSERAKEEINSVPKKSPFYTWPDVLGPHTLFGRVRGPCPKRPPASLPHQAYLHQ